MATNAELKAQVAALKKENEALRTRPQRARYGGGLWPNQNRRTDRDPEWQGTIRAIVPPEKQAGDILWIDVSEWLYNEETSPVQYKSNPPAFSVSLSPCTPDREAELEARRVKALGENA